MDNLVGLEIEIGENETYLITRRIGCWGATFQFPVYECRTQENNIPIKAIKILPRTAGGHAMGEEHGMWEAANTEVNQMLDCFIDPAFPTTLLLFEHQFIGQLNNVDYMCVLFAYEENMSLRSFMLGDQRFGRGFRVPLIRKAVLNMVKAIEDLHHFDLSHSQLTAGHIVCTHQAIKLAALCTAFELDLPAPAAQHFLPINRISDWGEAPEFDDGEEAQLAQPPQELKDAAAREGDFESQLEFWNKYHRERRDVWSIGVVALELGYGRIEVFNRNQFLRIASFIQQHGIMPDTWEQLLQNSEAFEPIHGNARRFSNSLYISFVRFCLQDNPYGRPKIQDVQAHGFLRPQGMISDTRFIESMLQ